MSEKINAIRTEAERIKNIAENPWLFDDSLTDEERIYWKLRGVCHMCGIDPHFHRDDCSWSANQQMLAGLGTGLFTFDSYTMQLQKTQNK
jgi:hypothetical protein